MTDLTVTVAKDEYQTFQDILARHDLRPMSQVCKPGQDTVIFTFYSVDDAERARNALSPKP